MLGWPRIVYDVLLMCLLLESFCVFYFSFVFFFFLAASAACERKCVKIRRAGGKLFCSCFPLSFFYTLFLAIFCWPKFNYIILVTAVP